jgi:hypothetical protein
MSSSATFLYHSRSANSPARRPSAFRGKPVHKTRGERRRRSLKIEMEYLLTVRNAWLLCSFLIALLVGWLAWRATSSTANAPTLAPIVERRPGVFLQRTFDPAAPPADMPPLGEGEEAECDSNYISDANVSGRLQKIDATNATATVTQVKVTLQLKITIWVPHGATQHVIEHEQGHRQISEHYYQFADKVAAEIAAPYIGRQISISGSDLNAEFHNALLQLSKQITAEYNDKLTPGPAQQRYDDLTDHSRNDRDANAAAAQAIKETM